MTSFSLAKVFRKYWDYDLQLAGNMERKQKLFGVRDALWFGKSISAPTAKEGKKKKLRKDAI